MTGKIIASIDTIITLLLLTFGLLYIRKALRVGKIP